MTGTSTGPDQDTGESEPSMEDILASIRRILSEEDAPIAQAALPEADILDLDETMLVAAPDDFGAPADANAEAVNATAPETAPPEPLIGESPTGEPPTGQSPASESSAADAATAEWPIPEPAALALAEAMPAPHLLAPDAELAAAGAVSQLVQALARERSTAVHAGGPTIEDLVRQEIRPILKDWLDQHLPPLVELLVRSEIARVVGRGVLGSHTTPD